MTRPAGRLALYAAGIEAATWAGLVPATWWHERRGRAAQGTLAERLGAVRRRAGRGPRVVVHAVSLGELAAARGFLAVLAESIPDASVTLTVGTQAARAVADAAIGQLNVDAVQYLPWDRPRAIRRWLSALQPSLVVILETELWPGLLDECRRLGVPVALASARVYPRDLARYRLIRGFLAPLLDGVSLVAAQSADERDRLIAIGAPAARTIVTGDLKAVSALLGTPPLAGALPSTVERSRALIVGGSTHDPEEQWLLTAFAAVRRVHPGAQLALAPRAIGRAPQVARAAAAAGFTVTATSAPGGDWDVQVVDAPGLLAGLYPHAAIAVVGGSLAPHGGHSLLEAAAAGAAVVCGPHATHVAAQVARFDAAGAVVHASRELLSETLVGLLGEPARARALGSAARDVVVTMAAEASRVGARLPALLTSRDDVQMNERAAV